MQQNINRIVVSGKEAKNQLLEGVNAVCDVVGSTLGARGSYNLFETLDGLPHLTLDGYDSLQMMFLAEPIQNVACELIKEACYKQHREVLDNTTLVCVLAQAFFTNSLLAVESGLSAIEVSENILKSVKLINEYLDKLAIPLTDKLIYDVAKTAGNGDEELALKVAHAFIQSGEHGTVSHGRSMTDETFVDYIQGNPIDSGFSDERFINVQEKQLVSFADPCVIVSSIHFETMEDIVPFINIAFPQNQQGVDYVAPRPLVFIATMEDNVKEALIANVKKGYPIAVLKPPYFGKKGREYMSDIALLLGCEVLQGISRSDYKGKELSYVGNCTHIEIKEKDTVLTLDKNLKNSRVKGRIDELLEQIKNNTNIHDISYLKQRIAKINGGISTVMVGGYTTSEIEERIARYDDAIGAVNSARDGVVAGGGVALMNASRLLYKIDNVTKKSIIAPFNKILSNANTQVFIDENHDKSEYSLTGRIIKHVKFPDYPIGYDVKEYKEVDMFESGIIDTLKGIKTALLNSASASNNLLRCNFVLPYKRNN